MQAYNLKHNKTVQTVLKPHTKPNNQPQATHAHKAITVAKILENALIAIVKILSATIARLKIITGAQFALRTQ